MATGVLDGTENSTSPTPKSMVVVLAKNDAKLRTTVKFLERRGLAAKIVPTLSEAIELFAKKEANMLLLSVNFPHPKVEILPILIYQSFEIETIVYAEDSDRKSSSRLNGAKTKHVLFGPVSGPVVFMKIRQIEREQNATNSETAVVDRKKLNDASVLVNQKSEAEKKAALDALLKSLAEPASEGDVTDDDLQKSGQTFVQKGQRSNLLSETQDGASNLDLGTISERAQLLRHGIDLGLAAAKSQPSARFRLILPNQFRATTNDRAGTLADDTLSSSPEVTQLATAGAGVTFIEQQRPISDAAVIQTCLREALAIVAGAPESSASELSAYKTAALVSLRTPNLTCSFIIGLAFAKRTASELFDRIETAFFFLLRDHGIEFENEQTHSILLDNMSVVARAFSASDYVLVSQTPDSQLGVATVVSKNPIASVEPYAENMSSVNVQDIPVDEPVTFNVFLHLKQNDKYIRYLKQGASLSRPQVTRLQKQHPSVLLDTSEVDAYRRHYAAHAIMAPKRRVS